MARSCGDCVHYRVCHVAKAMRELYHKLGSELLRMEEYEKLVEWARGIAEFCRLYTKVLAEVPIETQKRETTE